MFCDFMFCYFNFNNRNIDLLSKQLLLTLLSLKIIIISNIPAKPSKFVITNLMLKLCGFSFSTALKNNSNQYLASVNPYFFCYIHLAKPKGGVL